jgi:hypothetical protein
VQMWQGEPSPGADVAAVSPVPVQMWQGEPSPGANVGGVSPVPEQMWRQTGGVFRAHHRRALRRDRHALVVLGADLVEEIECLSAARAVARRHAARTREYSAARDRATRRGAWTTTPLGIGPIRAGYLTRQGITVTATPQRATE